MEPGFPSWADEIVEPRPDMNIKVTAFTVALKLYYSKKVTISAGGKSYWPKIKPCQIVKKKIW